MLDEGLHEIPRVESLTLNPPAQALSKTLECITRTARCTLQVRLLHTIVKSMSSSMPRSL